MSTSTIINSKYKMERKKILIIDDNISQLDLIEILFTNNGFETTQAANGNEALSMLQSNELLPDIILVDLMMPQISGVETIAKIRELSIPSPVIAFTALDDEELHQEALQAGAQMVLTKPCPPVKLLEHCNRLLIHQEELQ